jgi:hypothetical protein
MFGVPHVGHKDTTRMNSQLSRSTWKHDCQTLCRQEDYGVRSVRHRGMIHTIVHWLTELLEKSTQLCTQLLEDGILQELEGKEDKLHASMAYVKHRQRTMSLLENIKNAAEMKTL